MTSIFDRLKLRFKKWYLPGPALQTLHQSLAKTKEQDISCDQVFAVLDEFVEAVKRGENVLIFMPLVREHLNRCPACRKQYETLLNMLQPPIANDE